MGTATGNAPRSTRRTLHRAQLECRCNWRSLKAAALVASLGLSACSMCHAIGASDYAWVGWVALLPLFISIRILTPVQAMAAGVFWGLCLFVSPAITGDSIFSLGAGSLVLLTTLPGIYTWLGAYLTRRIGFSPFLLALGWMGVELCLAPLGLRNGLLAGTQSDVLVIHWLGNFAGCVLVAFLVAYVSAAVFDALSHVRLAIESRRFAIGSPDSARRAVPLESFSAVFHLIHPAQPRALPVRLGSARLRAGSAEGGQVPPAAQG